jgi:glycosyltransferase involved in cell wall biosynthesis
MSLCAFTQKVYKFCEEMTKRGHTVYHYGHENSKVTCTEHITVTNDEILERSYQDLNLWKTEGFNQSVHTEAVKIFNDNCIKELNNRIKSPNEFILCWFGFPSIGYDSMFAQIKMFETYSQMHKLHGASKTNVHFNKEFVVYPGFKKEDFLFKKQKSNIALFLGRVTEQKGAKAAYDMCNAIGQEIYFAGPNILKLKDTKYCKMLGFVEPEERKKLLSDAQFLLAPSFFVEPCNWTVIEAQFSGTPTITTDFGGFTETVKQSYTGFRCSTYQQFNFAVRKGYKEINPENCLKNAVHNFTIEIQCNHYEMIFKSLSM